MKNLTEKIDTLNLQKQIIKVENISTADLAEAMYREWKHKYQKVARNKQLNK